jgi:hypothetical protein
MNKSRSFKIGLVNMKRILMKVFRVYRSSGTKIKSLCAKIIILLIKLCNSIRQSLLDKSRANHSTVIKQEVLGSTFLEVESCLQTILLTENSHLMRCKLKKKALLWIRKQLSGQTNGVKL